MKSSKIVSFRHSVLVSDTDLRHLEKFLMQHFSRITYKVACEDGTKLEPETLEELLGYENPGFRRIAEISLVASNEVPLGDRLEVAIGQIFGDMLSGTTLGATQRAHLTFTDIKTQQPVEEELVRRLREMRPWYWWLRMISFKALLILAFFGAWLFLNAWSLLHKFANPSFSSGSHSPSRFTDGESAVLALGLFAILGIVGSCFDAGKGFLFPKYFFLIGRQIEEYHRRRKISNVVFGGIILAIVVNVLSSILMR